MKFRSRAGLLCLGILSLVPAVHAQSSIINVKVGYVSTTNESNFVFQAPTNAVLGGTSDYWNQFAYVSNTPFHAALVDNANNATGVTVTIANSTGVGFKNTTSGINPAFLFSYQPYQNPGGVFTISLYGLVPSTAYNFVGYASRTSSSAGAAWAITDGTLLSGTVANGTSMDISTGNGNAYSQFVFQSDVSGNAVITDSGNPGASITVLAGFQLQQAPVPEPSSYAVLGLGILGLIMVIRRKKAASTE
jgi:hypothetical protein